MHVLFIGAHPDDCDFSCGGTAALFAQRGDRVKFVSITNGDRGHYLPEYAADRSRLAARRNGEAHAAVAAFGGEYECLDVHDGEVYVTPELTERLVRLIRSWGPENVGPDLVLVNRPNDYHRDHRYGAQAVLDTAYLLTVPLMVPEVPHLRRMPAFAYWYDGFQEGGVFRPDVVVPIDGVLHLKARIAGAHESQFLEWLPYNMGTLDRVPPAEDTAGREAFLQEWVEARGQRVAEGCRALAPELMPFGCRLAEAFQISEYGRQPSTEELPNLFPVA